jgi:hypothetical protein
MSYITKHLPSYDELKNEIESNPEILQQYSKYESFIGDSDSVNYLIDKLLEDDIKANISIFQKAISYLTKKNDK